MEDMEELERLIGETPRAGTLEDINVALEQNMGEIFEQFDAQVEQHVRKAVSAALEKALGSANTATNPDLAKQISDLKAKVAGLKASLAAALKAMKDEGDGGRRRGRQQGRRLVVQQRGRFATWRQQGGRHPPIRPRQKQIGLKSDLKFNKDWNYQQKSNCHHLLEHCKPEEYKRQQKEYLWKQLENIE